MAGDQQRRTVQIQLRDLELLTGLFESRVMTLAHAAALHFGGRPEAAKKRVQKLKAAGLIRDRARRVNQPSVLLLTRAAYTFLSQEGRLENYPPSTATSFEKRVTVSDMTIRHELQVMDVKASFASALLRSTRFTIAEFCTWPQMCEFRACREDGQLITLRPDGLIRIHEQEADGALSEHAFFLEVDRSTETLDVLAAKAVCYRDYYRRGGFAVKCGASAEEYVKFPFRVLFILKSAERRDNIARRLLAVSPAILSQVCLATVSDVLTNPFGAVWTCPGDYRSGTPTGSLLLGPPMNRN